MSMFNINKYKTRVYIWYNYKRQTYLKIRLLTVTRGDTTGPPELTENPSREDIKFQLGRWMNYTPELVQ